MENENEYLEELMKKYRDISQSLLRYIPYFEQKKGQKNYQIYQGEQNTNSVAIPVYESTLLSFVKEVQRTGLVDRNYVYALSRNGIRTHEDEMRALDRVEFKDRTYLCDYGEICSRWHDEGDAVVRSGGEWHILKMSSEA